MEISSAKIQYEERQLGDCLELVIDHRGKTPKKLGADWVDQGIPTVSAKNVNGGRLVSRDSIRFVSYDVYKKWMKQDVKRGDCFLVSEGATLGECMLWDYDYPIVLGQRIFCLRADPNILYPRYLYAYMTSRAFQDEIIGRATGTSVDGLRQTEVLKLKITLPPLTQQRRIGDILYFLDNKIELNRRMNVTLEAMAQTLFQSWFVDFDPVRAKLDGRQSFAIDNAVASLFPDCFEDSKLGKIPKGWSVGPLRALAESGRNSIAGGPFGSKLTRTDYVDKGIPVIRGSNMTASMGWFRDCDFVYVSAEKAETLKTNMAAPGDVVFTQRGTLGQVALLPIDACHPRYVISQSQMKMTCASGVPPEYVYLFFRQPSVIDYIIGNATSSGVPHINLSFLREFNVLLPSRNVLSAFELAVRPLHRRITSNANESEKLAAIRETLLPKLLTGEIRPATINRELGSTR